MLLPKTLRSKPTSVICAPGGRLIAAPTFGAETYPFAVGEGLVPSRKRCDQNQRRLYAHPAGVFDSIVGALIKRPWGKPGQMPDKGGAFSGG